MSMHLSMKYCSAGADVLLYVTATPTTCFISNLCLNHILCVKICANHLGKCKRKPEYIELKSQKGHFALEKKKKKKRKQVSCLVPWHLYNILQQNCLCWKIVKTTMVNNRGPWLFSKSNIPYELRNTNRLIQPLKRPIISVLNRSLTLGPNYRTSYHITFKTLLKNTFTRESFKRKCILMYYILMFIYIIH